MQHGCCGATAEDWERIRVNKTQDNSKGEKGAGEERDAVSSRPVGLMASAWPSLFLLDQKS